MGARKAVDGYDTLLLVDLFRFAYFAEGDEFQAYVEGAAVTHIRIGGRPGPGTAAGAARGVDVLADRSAVCGTGATRRAGVADSV
ncbi:hypothetical protein ACIBMZ_27390 [Micromonospora sp. NPDC049900]|uniref:hypothetical protein n=1 Tax=Micromonospora sp. NPDC049900 TaxID=3364275 RepID=UPI0037BD18B5